MLEYFKNLYINPKNQQSLKKNFFLFYSQKCKPSNNYIVMGSTEFFMFINFFIVSL